MNDCIYPEEMTGCVCPEQSIPRILHTEETQLGPNINNSGINVNTLLTFFHWPLFILLRISHPLQDLEGLGLFVRVGAHVELDWSFLILHRLRQLPALILLEEPVRWGVAELLLWLVGETGERMNTAAIRWTVKLIPLSYMTFGRLY